MNRKKLVQKHFDKSAQLTIKNQTYRQQVLGLFQWLLAADEAADDHTTQLLTLNQPTNATINTKQNGTVAGIAEVSFLVKTFFPQLTIKTSVNDGLRISTHSPLMTMHGAARQLLSVERALLNILGHLSGIATQTRLLIEKINDPHAPYIAATRKTPWMWLDKKGVSMGGGLTHRLSLGDEIMVKDNHLTALQAQLRFSSIEKTIEHAVKKLIQSRQRYFELEVSTQSQAATAIQTFSAINSSGRTTMGLLLDNWRPTDVKRFVATAKKTQAYEHILCEASGDITAENIATWAKTGVDVLSLGALTHSTKQFNLSMHIS